MAFQTSGDAIPPGHENLLVLWNGLVRWKLNPEDKSLISDQCAIDRVPSSQEAVINVEVPRGGSSNATIKIGADGTLQESTGGVQDQLPATIATGLGTLLTAAGTLGGVALTAKASVKAAEIGAAAALGKTNQLLYAIEPRPNPDPPPRGTLPETVLLGLNAQISPGPYVYAIGIQWPFAQFRNPGGNALTVAPVTSSNMCSNPCFSNDPYQMLLNECTVTFDTIDANPTPSLPTEKKPAKGEGDKDE